MTKPWKRTVSTVLLTLACVIGLTGCEILGVKLPDLPFDLPELPFELPELPDLSTVELPFQPDSTDEAKEAQRLRNPAQLSSPALVQDGYLTVGIMSTTVTAPSCFQLSDGSIGGLDVGLAAIVADNLGLKVRYLPVSSVEAATTGICDVVMDARVEDVEGIEVVGFYEETAVAFFHMGEEGVMSIDDLNGHIVGVQGNSSSQYLLNHSNIQMEQREFENLNECFDALSAGTVEYVLCDAYSGGYLSGVHGGMAFCGCLEQPVFSGMAVAASNVELQSALQAAAERALTDGTNGIVRDLWIGGMSPLTSESVIPGVTISSTSTALGADTFDANAGPQDGSTAGANAADIG
ncbi:MAG: transporter substrate-binding domain-containing protein [Atopobiaceae bacterium]|nr:transporter substrate-binding domain-containing protein [Atopobiaceae bacterium]